MVTCPECRTESPDGTLRCRHCNHSFRIDPLKILAGLFLLAIALAAAGTFG